MMDDRHKVLYWMSGLDLKTCRKIAYPLHKFLQGFRKIKTRQGLYWCAICPCGKHQYARGICHHHYGQLARIANVVGWTPLVKMGLCRFSERDKLNLAALERQQAKAVAAWGH